MTRGKREGHGERVIAHGVQHDLMGRLAERQIRILQLGHVTDDEARQMLQPAAAPQLSEHSVKLVEVLVHLFEYKDLVPRIGCTGGVQGIDDERKVSSDDFTRSNARTVGRVGIEVYATVTLEEDFANALDGVL